MCVDSFVQTNTYSFMHILVTKRCCKDNNYNYSLNFMPSELYIALKLPQLLHLVPQLSCCNCFVEGKKTIITYSDTKYSCNVNPLCLTPACISCSALPKGCGAFGELFVWKNTIQLLGRKDMKIDL